MRKLALAALTVLAACSSESGDEAKEGAAAGPATKLNPGQWEITSEVSDITMAYKDVPPPDKAAMKTTISTCITPEQANRPPAEAFSGSKDGKTNCSYENFYMSRGRINASMNCPGNTGINIDGNFTPDTMDMNMELATYQGTASDMKMNAKLTGRRIGPCTPEAETGTEGKDPTKA